MYIYIYILYIYISPVIPSSFQPQVPTSRSTICGARPSLCRPSRGRCDWQRWPGARSGRRWRWRNSCRWGGADWDGWGWGFWSKIGGWFAQKLGFYEDFGQDKFENRQWGFEEPKNGDVTNQRVGMQSREHVSEANRGMTSCHCKCDNQNIMGFSCFNIQAPGQLWDLLDKTQVEVGSAGHFSVIFPF